MTRLPMRSVLIAACVVLFFGTVATATDPLEIRISERTRMTAEEQARIEAAVRECFPRAVERVVAFWGQDEARAPLEKVVVVIRDSDWTNSGKLAHSPSWGFRRGSAGSPTFRKRQDSLFVFAQPFLTGGADLETTLAHEMVHIVHESRYEVHDYWETPKRITEGIADLGAGKAEGRIRRHVNEGPYFTGAETLKDNDNLRDYGFGFAFRLAYGDDAVRALVDGLWAGKEPVKLVEKITGDDWKRVRRQAKKALKGYIDERIAAEPLYQEVHSDIKEHEYEAAIDGARLLLSRNPDSFWKLALNWDLARALRGAGRADDAIAAFDSVRTGAYGPTSLDDRAAYQIVRAYAKSDRCDEARAAYERFRPYYPKLWRDWKDEVDKMFRGYCEEH